MAKNLTEVIRSVEKDQRKELHFTLHKGKVAIIFNTIIFTSAVTYFFLGALKSRSSYTLLDIDLYLVLINKPFLLRKRYDIKKRVFNINIIDIKLHFVYTFLLNLLNAMEQILNLNLHFYYENVGPSKAFNCWWSYFVFENIGEK